MARLAVNLNAMLWMAVLPTDLNLVTKVDDGGSCLAQFALVQHTSP